MSVRLVLHIFMCVLTCIWRLFFHLWQAQDNSSKFVLEEEWASNILELRKKTKSNNGHTLVFIWLEKKKPNLCWAWSEKKKEKEAAEKKEKGGHVKEGADWRRNEERKDKRPFFYLHLLSFSSIYTMIPLNFLLVGTSLMRGD